MPQRKRTDSILKAHISELGAAIRLRREDCYIGADAFCHALSEHGTHLTKSGLMDIEKGRTAAKIALLKDVDAFLTEHSPKTYPETLVQLQDRLRENAAAKYWTQDGFQPKLQALLIRYGKSQQDAEKDFASFDVTYPDKPYARGTVSDWLSGNYERSFPGAPEKLDAILQAADYWEEERKIDTGIKEPWFTDKKKAEMKTGWQAAIDDHQPLQAVSTRYVRPLHVSSEWKPDINRQKAERAWQPFHIGSQCKAIRYVLGFNQSEMALALDVNPTVISKWEHWDGMKKVYPSMQDSIFQKYGELAQNADPEWFNGAKREEFLNIYASALKNPLSKPITKTATTENVADRPTVDSVSKPLAEIVQPVQHMEQGVAALTEAHMAMAKHFLDQYGYAMAINTLVSAIDANPAAVAKQLGIRGEGRWKRILAGEEFPNRNEITTMDKLLSADGLPVTAEAIVTAEMQRRGMDAAIRQT
ncbi:MAG: hypothetical protein U1E36_09435 [Rickettsiales bacterium]